VGPGSILEWAEEGDHVVVRRVGRFSSEDIHRALFKDPPQGKSLNELKDAIGRHARKKHARG